MVKVKCGECGKEFQLNPDDNPDDFQCECGGNLGYLEDTTSEKTEKSHMKTISDFRKASNEKSSKSKTKYKEKKDHSRDFNKLRSLIEGINKRINPLALITGLAVSVIVLILASFIFGALMVITGISSIIFYGILTLVTMTLIGSFVTSFVGSHHLDDGTINGTILSLIILIGIGLIVGFALFIIIGIVASIMASLSSLSSLGASSAANATSGSTSNPFSSVTSLINIFYGIIGIILTIIAGAGGGALGVLVKKKLKISL